MEVISTSSAKRPIAQVREYGPSERIQEESRKKQRVEAVTSDISMEDSSSSSSEPSSSPESLQPRFTIEKHPDPQQRKTYGTEYRLIVPKPLVIVSNEDADAVPVLAGLVTVALVDFRGNQMPNEDQIIGCERGSTQKLEKLRRDSPTVWSPFSIRPNGSTEGNQVRLRFTIDYILEDDPSRCLRERVFTKPFEITTKKKKSKETEILTSPSVPGETTSAKVTILPSVPAELTDLIKETMEGKVIDRERRFACTFPECDKAFKRADHLKNHLITHTPALQRGFQCKYCKKEFHFKHHITEHEKIHQREFQCDFEDCTLSFDKQSQLLTHKKKHTNIKPYACPDCPQLFDYPSQLKTHQRSHAVKPPKNIVTYVCTEGDCKESFSTKEKLRVHLKDVHDISAKELCPLCGHSFVRLSHHLIRGHKLDNSKLELITCEEEDCDGAFATKASYVLHMRVQHSQGDPLHPCEHEGCGESFYRKASLEKHMMKHSDKEKMDVSSEKPVEKAAKNLLREVFRIEPSSASSTSA